MCDGSRSIRKDRVPAADVFVRKRKDVVLLCVREVVDDSVDEAFVRFRAPRPGGSSCSVECSVEHLLSRSTIAIRIQYQTIHGIVNCVCRSSLGKDGGEEEEVEKANLRGQFKRGLVGMFPCTPTTRGPLTNSNGRFRTKYSRGSKPRQNDLAFDDPEGNQLIFNKM